MTGASPPIPPPTPGSSPQPGGQQQKAGNPSKRPARLIMLGALMVSLLSLVVALTSFATARVAREQAADAVRLAEAQSGQDADGSSPAGDPVAVPPTAGPRTPAAAPQSLHPQADFVLRYSNEVLNLQVTQADDGYVDLNEPRVTFDQSQADLVLRLSYGSETPQIDLESSAVTAARADTPELTPEDCLELIRTGPLPPSAEVPTPRGTVLCILTSLTRAVEDGISQKLVVLRVTALGRDGLVTIELNAWEQPR